MTSQQPFLEILTAAFSTGEIKPYAISGGYFEILDCAYPVTVNLIGLHGELKGIMRNAEASFYLKGGDYQTITIQSNNAQTVRFAFGTSEAGTRRTAGVVSVVDGGRARTQANQAFATSIFQPPGGATTTSHCQLWNPPGSGVNVVVGSWSISTSIAGGFAIGITNAAQASNISATRIQSKLGGAINGKAEARLGTPVGFPANALHGSNIGPNSVQTYEYTEPIVLPPGFGLTAWHGTLNADLAFNSQWYEEAI